MSRGRRYSGEKKLNLKKVFAVIITIIVIIMFVIGIKKLLSTDKKEKISNESYYASFEDNKYGVINSKGENIIVPSYQELITIPNKNKDVFLCVYDVDYTNNTYKTKALNSKNEEIYSQYENIEAIENYDTNNNVSYNSNVLKVQKNNKYGLINLEGKEILPCEYDEISAIIGNENSIKVSKDGKVGVVDNNGKKVIDIKYKNIEKLSDDYKNGYIVENDNNLYGTVDCANNRILESKYTEINPVYENGMYIVKGTKGYNVVDKTGNIITKKEYEDITDIKNSQIIVAENKKYGLINTSGEQIIPCNYDELKFINNENFIVKQNNKYGIIDASNKNVLENKYNTINYIKNADIIEVSEDGINSDILNNKLEKELTGIVSEINVEKGYFKIRIENEYKYYNFKFEEKSYKDINSNNTIFLDKKNGKYGFVDIAGNVVVDYIYDDATEQNNLGFAAVNKDGKWGSIDKNGNVVATIENDLSENSTIDFIGKWHLMKDSNLNCYTK